MASFPHCHPGNSDGNTLNRVKCNGNPFVCIHAEVYDFAVVHDLNLEHCPQIVKYSSSQTNLYIQQQGRFTPYD